MTEQSNQAMNESLSALADGEASPLELRRLLKASADDPQLRGRWSRYQIAGTVIRGELDRMAPEGFADSVSDAIADEVAHSTKRHWWQRAGQVAVAASVAGVVLLGVQQYPGGTDGTGGAESQPVADSAAEPADTENDVDRSQPQPASLPAGYKAPSLPSARTASAESGYEPLDRPAREVIFVPVRSDTEQVPAEEIQAYLNQLMREHSSHAARNSNQGVLPFARVSSDEEE